MSFKRQSDILRAVRQYGSCHIADLAGRLSVSTETIRRNVQPLIESGEVIRFHGGIMLPDHLDEPPFQRRMQVNKAEKRKVADIARGLINDGDTIILDNGTTTTYVAEALADKSGLVVITNSAQIACRLAARNGHRVFMAGGELSGDDAAAFGHSTVEFVAQFQAKFALLSVAGITTAGDLVDFHMFEAEFSRAAMRQAQETWVIADHTKFGRDAPVRVCGLSDVDLVVTDHSPKPEFSQLCVERGVRVMTSYSIEPSQKKYFVKKELPAIIEG